MLIRYFLGLFFLFFIIAGTNAQIKMKAKRKGVTPIDITKNKTKKAATTEVFTLEQFAGKWQEVSRTDRSGDSVEITDTIFLKFSDRNRVETRDGVKLTIKGAATIDPPGNILVAAADVYTILSVTKEKIVLYDQDRFIHTFNKKEQFWSETLGKLSVSEDVYKDPISVQLSDIMGNWRVYRRLAKPGAIVLPPTSLIKNLKITNKTGENTAKGEITFYQFETESSPCTIKVNNAFIEITAGTNNWTLFVYKADGKEFIFGNTDELLYYAKPM